MARKKKRVDQDLEMDMTPMIDIVFNLLIFFMLISDLTNKDIALRKQACIAFWQCADQEARKKFQDMLRTAKVRRFENGCTLLGFDRSANGFEYAVELLRAHFGRKSAKTVGTSSSATVAVTSNSEARK